MDLGDLIQYIHEKDLLIGLRLKCRAFLLVQDGQINDKQFMNAELFKQDCTGNNLLHLNYMISKGEDNWNCGLSGACFGGHLNLAKLMITKGASYWNLGLFRACVGGHLDLVELMISNGANNWNGGLTGACRGGHKYLAELMISNGANECNSWLCQKSIAEHLK